MASGGSDNAFSLPSSASRSSKTFVDDYGMYNQGVRIYLTPWYNK